MKKLTAIQEKLIDKGYVFGKVNYVGGDTKEMSLQKRIENMYLFSEGIKKLGYKLSDEGYKLLFDLTWGEGPICQVSKTIYSQLVEFKKADRKYDSLFSQFPHLNQELNDSGYYNFVQVINYIIPGLGDLYDFEIKPREELIIDDKGLKELKIIWTDEHYENALYEYTKDLLKSKTVFNEAQVILLKELLNEEIVFEKIVEKLDNKDFTIKENIAVLNGYLYEKYDTVCITLFKTVTDVLRFVNFITGNDKSLKEKPLYKSLKRKTRRNIMRIFDTIIKENNKYDLQETLKNKDMFIKLAEVLHTGEYKKQYPKAFHLFNDLRNTKKGKINEGSFNSKLEVLLKAKDIKKTADLLITRPGEFFRKLDWLVRNSNDDELKYVFNLMKTLEPNKVDNKVLFGLLPLFESRTSRKERVFKYHRKNKFITHKIDNELPALSKPLVSYLKQEIVNVIKNNYKNRKIVEDIVTVDEEGNKTSRPAKIYLDESMKNIKVPSNSTMRFASSGNQVLTPGSTIKLDYKEKFLRFFVHWKGYDIDIDLTASLYDDNFNLINFIGWNGDKTSDNNSFRYSGDRRHVSEGVEFVDMNLEFKNKVRYVLVTASSYNGTNWKNISDCFAGVMARDGFAGKDYEPSTVLMSSNLIGDHGDNLLFYIYDVDTKEFTWLDTPANSGGAVFNSRDGKSVSTLYNHFQNVLSVYDIVKFYTNVEFTDNPKEADFRIGGENADITIYDIEKISNLI